MSERLHMPDALRNLNINARKLAAVPLAAALAFVGVGCEMRDSGVADLTCYLVGSEGGGINGPGHTTESGAPAVVNEVAAGALAKYYGPVADANGDGKSTTKEIRAYAKATPFILDIPGVGKYRLQDGGDAKRLNGEDGFDLAMSKDDCLGKLNPKTGKREGGFHRRKLPFTLMKP